MTDAFTRNACLWLGIFFRLLFVLFGCLVDGLSRLRFTDVDYLVFSAAADNVFRALRTGDGTGNLPPYVLLLFPISTTQQTSAHIRSRSTGTLRSSPGFSSLTPSFPYLASSYSAWLMRFQVLCCTKCCIAWDCHRRTANSLH